MSNLNEAISFLSDMTAYPSGKRSFQPDSNGWETLANRGVNVAYSDPGR